MYSRPKTYYVLLLAVIVLVSSIAGASAYYLTEKSADSEEVLQPDERFTAMAEEAIIPARVVNAEAESAQKIAGISCDETQKIYRIDKTTPVFLSEQGDSVVAELEAKSIYLKEDVKVWLQRISQDGTRALIVVPWASDVNKRGWIDIDPSKIEESRRFLVANLDRREMVLYEKCVRKDSYPIGIGAEESPTPTGRMSISELVDVPASQPYFGSFAFGLTTRQPNLPQGWGGSDQMAIHGTDNPSSIGKKMSAGCLRISENSISRLKEVAYIGMPVVIE